MNPPAKQYTRRQVLRLAGAAGSLAAIPTPLWSLAKRDPQREAHRLVLLFLEGGNDGLNTVIPFEDDRYRNARPRLAYSGGNLPKLDPLTGLHPGLAPWQSLYDEGRLTVLRDVGYERPDRSHFVSRDIWHSGLREPGENPTGWIGKVLDRGDRAALPPVALGSQEAPLILRGSVRSGLTLRSLEDFQLQFPSEERDERLAALEAGAESKTEDDALSRISKLAGDAYRTAESLRESIAKIPPGKGYPQNRIGEQLRLAARLIRAEAGPDVLWTHLGGFDTHSLQQGNHASLMQQVGTATTAFMRDLAKDGQDQNTLLLIYSEFGRRVRENGSVGTDHGAAGPMFAIGGSVRGGLIGPPTDLENLIEGDVRPRIDFRKVFHEAAYDWMGWKVPDLFPGFDRGVGYLS